MTKLFQTFCALLVAVLVLSAAAAQNQVTFERGSLSIRSGDRLIDVSIEIARSKEQRARGLMFRRELGDTEGMLFDYGYPQQASMWMKNTYIPLDMLFVRSDGVIEKIVVRTTPHSLDSIYSKGEVRAVLELKGGMAEKLGIRVGDKIIHPIFPN